MRMGSIHSSALVVTMLQHSDGSRVGLQELGCMYGYQVLSMVCETAGSCNFFQTLFLHAMWLLSAAFVSDLQSRQSAA